MVVLAGLLVLLAQGAEMAPPGAGALDGRPAAADASPLQARIDAAVPGSRIDVEPGTYVGDLFIDRAVRLIGRGRPLLVGSGTGSVVRIRADDVRIEGFDIDGRDGGSLAADSSGIHIAARRAIVRACRISRAFFGVYLREADGAIVESTIIRGTPGRAPGEQGSGIHVWNTEGFRLAGNDIRHTRDGLYVQSSHHGQISGNTASDLRYGLHYMFSDDNVFEDNRFEHGAAGAALMYSRRIVFRRNRFLHNRGFASVGLLLKECEDVTAEHNLIADNARGLFVEGSRRVRFRANVVAESDVALVVYDSSADAEFSGNAFFGNLSPLQLVGRRISAVFDGNYWSGHHEPDLDGDGVSDGPYRLTSVFDHFRGNVLAADLLAQSFAARVLAAAEQSFPVLRPVPVVDRRPLARVPDLSDVPAAVPASGSSVAGLSVSGLFVAVGLAVWSAGRRGRSHDSRAT